MGLYGQQLQPGQAVPGAPQPATFSQEYHGVLNGIMSTVQLGFTGVSLIYFVQNIRTMFGDFKGWAAPLLRKALEFLSPKAGALFILQAVYRFFTVGTPTLMMMRLGVLGCFLALLYIYLLTKKRQSEALERRIERLKEFAINRTSEEFWHR
jgi:hypothetical protein